MIDSPLLTISIPTYNRSACLNLLLQSIVSQITSRDANHIEICIFDNCSTDNTAEVVESFTKKHGYVSYICNDKNIGADNNFIKAFLAARGKFFWILGDDEVLLDGAIQWILKFCQEREFGCLYLSPIPEYLPEIPKFLGRSIDSPVKLKAYTPYHFAKAVNYSITFLSSSIVNRTQLLEWNSDITKDIEQFSNSNLVHLTWIFSAILSMPTSYLASTPLLAATRANSGGYRPVKVFIVNFPTIFGHYFSIIDPKASSFIRFFTLVGWFPKVVFDLRFSKRYQVTGYGVNIEEFPEEMKVGFIWWIFSHFVLAGSRGISFFGMLLLKGLHKLLQWVYLVRGKNISRKF